MHGSPSSHNMLPPQHHPHPHLTPHGTYRGPRRPPPRPRDPPANASVAALARGPGQERTEGVLAATSTRRLAQMRNQKRQLKQGQRMKRMSSTSLPALIGLSQLSAR